VIFRILLFTLERLSGGVISSPSSRSEISGLSMRSCASG